MKNLQRINIFLTFVFLVVTVVAAVVFTPTTRAIGVFVDLVLFGVGVAAFIWGYFSAVQRSRVDEISVASLYFLSGQVANKQVQKIMNGCLIAQLVIGLAGAIARSSTDGKAGSTLAFGVLVPLLGLGLNGLWASQFGTFTPRELPDRQG
jgi:ABC-type enterobactin transport system permease subunit